MKSSKATPDEFYRKQVEYRERVDMEIELKRYMGKMDTQRRLQDSQPRANRRSNEIIQEFARQHSRNQENQMNVHQRLYQNMSLLQHQTLSKSQSKSFI